MRFGATKHTPTLERRDTIIDTTTTTTTQKKDQTLSIESNPSNTALSINSDTNSSNNSNNPATISATTATTSSATSATSATSSLSTSISTKEKDSKQEDNIKTNETSNTANNQQTEDVSLLKMQDDVVVDLLSHYCEQGDVQMCSTIALVLGDQRIFKLFPDQQVQQWHNAYVEQLMSLRLFVIASDVMSHAGGKISEWNRRETTVYTACKRCGNRTIDLKGVVVKVVQEDVQDEVHEDDEDRDRDDVGNGKKKEVMIGIDGAVIEEEVMERGICDRCRRYTTCVLCEQPVRGPFVWRSQCGHGGHINCMENWRKTLIEEHLEEEENYNRRNVVVVCPAGCDV